MKGYLLGFPDDSGVRNVKGRPGAAKGPSAFRLALDKFTGKDRIINLIEDYGDILPSDDIRENHSKAAKEIAKHENYNFSVIIGGGHDYVFPHIKGIAEAFPGKKIGCINIDVHLDLRKDKPVITSGSGFYSLIEKGVISSENLIEFGSQEHCNSTELWDYAKEKNLKIYPFSSLRNGKAFLTFKAVLEKLSESCDQIVISLDLDSIQSAFAPGVSAPAVEGFMPSEILEMIETAGGNNKVRSIGIYELNPNFDIDNRTASLAALVAYRFIIKKSGNHL